MVGVRRRSRPWLPLWGSWRAISEPERAQAVESLRIGALIAAGYPLSHDIFSIFATAYTLSVTATPCQLSLWESQGAGAARPSNFFASAFYILHKFLLHGGQDDVFAPGQVDVPVYAAGVQVEGQQLP